MLCVAAHPDDIEYGMSAAVAIWTSRGTIRALRPDVVCVASWEIEYVARLNQSDHRAAGVAVIDAVRDAGNRTVFTELAAEGLEPWSVRWLLTGAP